MKGLLKTDGKDKTKVLIFSLLFMGLAHICLLKRRGKGLALAFIEIMFLMFTVVTTLVGSGPSIYYAIMDMTNYGVGADGVVYNAQAHNFILIEGVMAMVITFLFLVVYGFSVRDALNTYKKYCISKKFEGIKTASRTIDESFPIFALAPAVVLVLFFVIIPLVFAAVVAFTDYTTVNQNFKWVGFENFKYIFGGNAVWSSALGSVVAWTLVWAILATFTCYFGGLIVAVLLSDNKTKMAPYFRTIFILPYAIPAIVSMRVWFSLLNGTSGGIVNRTLMDLHLISKPVSFFSSVAMARFLCILINLWAGFPYFMLLSMGTMTSISGDVLEAAKIDGASKFQIFKSITLPLVLYQTAPLIIMSFVHNINNFGAIYYLTGGAPNTKMSTSTFAQGTDIVVTWIYKLTVDQGQYRYASVLAIMVFMVLCPVAIWNFRRTKSFKEGEL